MRDRPDHIVTRLRPDDRSIVRAMHSVQLSTLPAASRHSTPPVPSRPRVLCAVPRHLDLESLLHASRRFLPGKLQLDAPLFSVGTPFGSAGNPLSIRRRRVLTTAALAPLASASVVHAGKLYVHVWRTCAALLAAAAGGLIVERKARLGKVT